MQAAFAKHSLPHDFVDVPPLRADDISVKFQTRKAGEV